MLIFRIGSSVHSGRGHLSKFLGRVFTFYTISVNTFFSELLINEINCLKMLKPAHQYSKQF